MVPVLDSRTKACTKSASELKFTASARRLPASVSPSSVSEK
ncbi:glyoxalase [Listeria monocytogenes]|nr:glyoxalase [Listeria monocytogenes]